MKLYLTIIIFTVYLIASFGFLLPYLISAADNYLVMEGVVYIISIPVIGYYTIKSIINQIKNKIKPQN